MLKDGCQIKSSFEIAVALTDNSIPLLLMLPTLAHVLSKMLGGTGTLYSKSRSLVVRSYKSSVKETFLKKVTSTPRSEEHTSELQSRENLVCRLLLEKKKKEYT